MEQTLREIADLLDRYDRGDVSPTLRRFADEAAVASDESEASDVARRVLRLFTGGMGGFGDIVLDVDGRVDREAQAQFGALHRRLFEQARDALSSRDI